MEIYWDISFPEWYLKTDNKNRSKLGVCFTIPLFLNDKRHRLVPVQLREQHCPLADRRGMAFQRCVYCTYLGPVLVETSRRYSITFLCTCPLIDKRTLGTPRTQILNIYKWCVMTNAHTTIKKKPWKSRIYLWIWCERHKHLCGLKKYTWKSWMWIFRHNSLAIPLIPPTGG